MTPPKGMENHDRPAQKIRLLGTTPLTALIAARLLIEKPENWTQGSWGDAGQHCMGGALSRSTAYGLETFDAAVTLLRAEVPTGMSLQKFNDSSTHADVIAAYDRAILKALAASEFFEPSEIALASGGEQT